MSDAASQVQAGLPPDQPHAPAAAPPPPLIAGPRPRLWPGVAVVVLMLLAIWAPVWLEADPFVKYMCAMWAPMAAALGVVVWWTFFSRVRWLDRLLILGAFAVGATAAVYLSSMFAMLLIVYALPVVLTAWVLWLVVASFLSWPIQKWGLVAVLLLTCLAFDCLRFDGLDGNFRGSLSWRWSSTPEDRFLATKIDTAPAAASLTLQPGDWAGFRGPERDGRRTGVRIATDWNEHPPKELWRHLVGPGWGSFAVVGDMIYTQEQRGKNESVVCYDAKTGKLIWAHDDVTRFHEDLGGDGPRATPTFHDGKIYALGANGRLNCLDATTGEVKWTRNIADDSGVKVPMWGFVSSPLVVGKFVTVFAGGPDGKSVLAYDADKGGEPAWVGGDGKLSYSSPHPARIDGIDQVLISTDAGITAFNPAKGDVLWKYDWPTQGMHRILQPTVVGDSDLLLGSMMPGLTRRIHVSHDNDVWKTEEVWTSPSLKPNFSDAVVYDGYAYGFDAEPALVCINLEDGTRKWRAKGYGAGQVLLLADQGLLLVVSEKPSVAALLKATPEGRQEIGRFPLFNEQEKTWNHPVVAHGKLFVRNAEEAACFELKEEGGASERK